MYFCSLGSASLALGGQTRAAFPAEKKEPDQAVCECLYEGSKQKVGRVVGRILKVLDDSLDDRK